MHGDIEKEILDVALEDIVVSEIWIDGEGFILTAVARGDGDEEIRFEERVVAFFVVAGGEGVRDEGVDPVGGGGGVVGMDRGGGRENAAVL